MGHGEEQEQPGNEGQQTEEQQRNPTLKEITSKIYARRVLTADTTTWDSSQVINNMNVQEKLMIPAFSLASGIGGYIYGKPIRIPSFWLGCFTGGFAAFLGAYTLSWKRLVGFGYTNATYKPAIPGTYFDPDQEVDKFLERMGRKNAK